MYVRYDRKKLCNMPCVEAGRGGPAVPSMHPSFLRFTPISQLPDTVDRRPFLFIYLGSRLARCARTKSRDHAGKRKREESLNTQAFTVKCSFLAHLVALCGAVSTRDADGRARLATWRPQPRAGGRAPVAEAASAPREAARQSRAGVWPAPTRSGRACDGALPAPHESQVGGSLAFCESESRRPDPEEWQQRVAFRE